MHQRPGRPHRLPLSHYPGRRTVSFDACTWNRVPLFTSHDVVDVLVGHLRQASEESKCIVPIYCFMPDHLHVMIQGLEDDSNALGTMSRFKYLSGGWMHRNGLAGWQGNFFDHIMRPGEDWRQHASYIAMNPVRAGLATDVADYPFLGSIGCDLGDAMSPWGP